MSVTTASTTAHPQYPAPVVLDWPKALRVSEMRYTRRHGHPPPPATLRSWAAGARDLASRWMPDYHTAWANLLEARAAALESPTSPQQSLEEATQQ